PGLHQHTLTTLPRHNADSLDTLLFADAQARQITERALAHHALHA
ncbi:1-deoxy-D-xylulose-5-phosphate reductoisomerase, partial [Xanthomonas perforans]|nr:1-deoxy-D-xylulose-5-phosphate reductoisomerase [Xanthomonas perforans]